MERANKKARNEGNTIVFIDESGLTEHPLVARSWSPRDQTPQQPFSLNCSKLAIIAGMMWWEGYHFRLYRGPVRTPQVMDSPRHPRRQLRRNRLALWDGLAAHRSALVHHFIQTTRGDFVVTRLPAYNPELNPSEDVWDYLKRYTLATSCPQDWFELTTRTRHHLRHDQTPSRLGSGFPETSHLSLCLDVTHLCKTQQIIWHRQGRANGLKTEINAADQLPPPTGSAP